MIRTYKITGMTCAGCVAKVQQLLSNVTGVRNTNVNLDKGEATIEMENPVSLEKFRLALREHPKYQIADLQPVQPSAITDEEKRSWLETYKPILVVFAYLLGITLLIEYRNGGFSLMNWMQNFMGGFFIVFSFFKILNLNGFADSYSMYDIVAKRWRPWAFAYAFIELSLGIAFVTGFNPLFTNILTFLVMFISIIGVIQSVMNKRKIRCACLGAVFNLPMSTITITEDSLMIIMSAVMIVNLF